MRMLMMAVAAVALAGCETVDSSSRLDDLLAGRCASAEQRIAQLEATADLYDADELAERLHRARRLAEIWCLPDAAAPVVPVLPPPADPPTIDGGGTDPAA